MAAAVGANATAATTSSKSKPKRETKSSPANGSKKSSRSTPVKQSNTLDMWFKQAAPMAKSGEKAAAGQKTDAATSGKDDNTNAVGNGQHSTSASSESLEVLNVDPPLKKKKVNPESASAKKLVQRRIHINDLCRVCGNARTEASSRCELRCMGCDMTVHTKCYDIQLDEPVDEWHCRHCQYILDKKEELKSGGIETVVEDDDGDKDTALLPTHEHLEATHKYHELHSSSDFATIFQFLKRFRRMGLKVSSDVTLHNLADALTSPQQNLAFIKDLHVRLLTNVEATMSKNHGWTVSLARFLKETERHPSSTRVDALLAVAAEPSSKKGNSETSTESALSTRTKELYVDLSVSERVAILKFLCEAQFDENEVLVEHIGDQEGDSLHLFHMYILDRMQRDEPVGTDASGRTYWVLEDAPSVLDGTVWVCRCAKQDGSDWETVADDLETLESLITWLSLSFEMLELQLWTMLSSGILKSLTRRHKKKLQSEQRMARMPRLLGTAGLDLASLAPAGGDDGFGVRRSMRARRAVSYRIEESDEEEEEEDGEDAENASDDDGEEEDAATASGKEDDDDMRPRKRLRRSRSSLDASKPAIAPSRQSARLCRSTRGANSNDDDDVTVRSSPVRRRSGRRVVDRTGVASSSSSKRRRRHGAHGHSSSASSSSSSSESDEDANDSDDAKQD